MYGSRVTAPRPSPTRRHTSAHLPPGAGLAAPDLRGSRARRPVPLEPWGSFVPFCCCPGSFMARWAAVGGPPDGQLIDITGSGPRPDHLRSAWSSPVRRVRAATVSRGVASALGICVLRIRYASRSGAPGARASARAPGWPPEARPRPGLAAGAVMPGSVIIMPIALPSPSGSRPSCRTTVVVRRFGFLAVAPFLLAASRAVSRAWRARSTPDTSPPLTTAPRWSN